LLLPRQNIVPGKLAEAWAREVDRLSNADAVNRLWAKDPSLWGTTERDEQSVAANLAWLDLPEQIGAYMARVGQLATKVKHQGFQDVVFIAMGDSNLAAETLLRTTAKKRFRRVFLLDSTDPYAIQAIDEQLDYPATLFVVASKTGKRIETHALLLYFLDKLKGRSSGEPARCFIAVTQENSYLAELAGSYGFLETLVEPPGIAGRYSSLIHFGLLLSGIWSYDPETLVAQARAMRDLCQQPAGSDRNPAVGLAALLAAGAVEGYDKFLLVGTRSLSAATLRIAQLVGASISKGGKGLIPVSDGALRSPEIYQRGCIAAIFAMQGDEAAEVKQFEARLKQVGVPTVSVEMNAPEQLGAGLFKWELATALACSLLQVNPFSEPDAQQNRGRVSEILEGLTSRHEWPTRTARVREKGIDLYAEGGTRLQISTLNLYEALRTFLEARKPDGYLAIITFAGGRPAIDGALDRLREQLASRLGIPVSLSSGPRYLGYFEQVYKGGPPKGLFLILTTEPAVDIAIPGAGYTFGQLQLALAVSDFESLESRRKLVLRLHLTLGLEQGLAELEQLVQKL
jgi:transaldolase/glucose-6-phosphate isomerase